MELQDWKIQRAYFAAHAPEVPEWFTVEVPSGKPEIPRADRCLSPEAYAAMQGLRAATRALKEELDAFNALIYGAQKNLEQWNVNNNLRRMTAWRWTYADAMMAGFGK